MYNILIKHNDSKTLWQLYGTTTSAASNTETFTPFETNDLEKLFDWMQRMVMKTLKL